MGFPDTDRNRAAVHEAGHALIAVSRGVGVAAIELYGSGGAGVTRLSEKPSGLDGVWIWYGGPFAEEVIFGKWTLTSRPAGLDDLFVAHKLCQQIGISDITGITNQVEAYLRGQQDRLELVATRLLAVNKAQGAELAELLQDRSRPRPAPAPQRRLSTAFDLCHRIARRR